MLHLSGLGPKHAPVRQPDELNTDFNMTLSESPDSLLTIADLVFIDPPDTGFNRKTTWSRGDREQEQEDVYFTEEDDISDLYQYIDHLISTKRLYGRAIYIIGESYGAHRAVGIARKFAEQFRSLAGLVLISPALTSSTQAEGADIYLPAVASIMSFHNFIPKEDYNNVSQFSVEHYRKALAVYPESSAQLENEIANEVSKLTLLEVSWLLNHGLSYSLMDIDDVLVNQKRVAIDHYDGRYVKKDLNSKNPQSDRGMLLQSYVSIVDRLATWLASNGYYEPQSYQWKSRQPSNFLPNYYVPFNSDIDTMDSFLRARTRTRVIMTCGQYDLVVPCRAIERKTHKLRERFKERVTLDVYQSGHMPYIDPTERKKLLKSIKDMISSAHKSL